MTTSKIGVKTCENRAGGGVEGVGRPESESGRTLEPLWTILDGLAALSLGFQGCSHVICLTCQKKTSLKTMLFGCENRPGSSMRHLSIGFLA